MCSKHGSSPTTCSGWGKAPCAPDGQLQGEAAAGLLLPAAELPPCAAEPAQRSRPALPVALPEGKKGLSVRHKSHLWWRSGERGVRQTLNPPSPKPTLRYLHSCEHACGGDAKIEVRQHLGCRGFIDLRQPLPGQVICRESSKRGLQEHAASQESEGDNDALGVLLPEETH